MTEEVTIQGEEATTTYSDEATYWAKVVDGVVQNVIHASERFIKTDYVDTSPGRWVETRKDGSIRKNYASIGHLYDVTRDAFYRRQPFPSWTLNEETCRWEAPIERPSEGYYDWDEEAQQWVATSFNEE